MKILSKLAPVAFALAALAASASSQAGLVFEIQRISDQEALITGSGTLDAQVPGYVIAFAGASPVKGTAGSGPMSGNMQLGGVDLTYAYIRMNQNHFILDFRDYENLPAGAALTGSLTVSLKDAELWAPIGTTGNLYNEVANNFVGTQLLGTYSIVGPDGGGDVPEPGSFALLGVGLAGLAAVRRRKQG